MENVLPVDRFKAKFKYYKSNNPKPSLHEVLSVDNHGSTDKVMQLQLKDIVNDPRAKYLGLTSQKWVCYTFRDHPGLILVRNPFTSAGQRYWMRRCLEQYPRKPNKTNLDTEIDLPDWWQACYKEGHCNMVLQKKLRWTTLGYHHNWDTKQYTEGNCTPFPEDLSELSEVVAQHLGFDAFKAEAAIVNYYHMDSTLAPHTDHSEYYLDAPLFSFSFGQSAVFLIGGKDKSIQPSALLLQSGDIAVMSQEARLCYHAVPRILPAATKPWVEPSLISGNLTSEMCGNRDELVYRKVYSKDVENDSICDSNNEINHNLTENVEGKDFREVCSESIVGEAKPNMKVTFKYLTNYEEILSILDQNAELPPDWDIFANYMEKSRINMNVRQVLNTNNKKIGLF